MQDYSICKGSNTINAMYFMGGTWTNKSLLSLDIEHNFASCLVQEGLNVHGFDLIGLDNLTELPNTAYSVKEAFNFNKATALESILKNNITVAFTYSSGIHILMYLIMNVGVKFDRVVFIDPCPSYPLSRVDISNDFYRISRVDLQSDLHKLSSITDEKVMDKYLNALFGVSDTIYPPRYNKWVVSSICPNLRRNRELFTETLPELVDYRVVFTNSAGPHLAETVPLERSKHYPENSHWIMIEDARKDLASYVGKFLTSKNC